MTGTFPRATRGSGGRAGSLAPLQTARRLTRESSVTINRTTLTSHAAYLCAAYVLGIPRWSVDLGSLLALSFLPFCTAFVAFFAFIVVSFRAKVVSFAKSHSLYFLLHILTKQISHQTS